MMEEIKPKKERKFLKAMGDIALVLFRELVLGIGKKVINKVGNKRQALAIAFLMVAGISYAAIDSIPYPITGNKQRLGLQTSGNGLVWRGVAADTVTKPTSYADKNIKAYLILDSVSGSLYVFKQGAWAAISGAGGFTQPLDSLFFDTSVPSNDVDTAKMRWDSELGTVVLGMYDQVPNELGFKNFWLVKNQTGSTITKGSIVYANGTVGASGRITVAKFIANGSIDAKYLLGITAHDLTDGEDGYVISFGKIRQVNTDTFAAGSILYPSPTTAGVWTDIEPVAPNLDMPIGFCINSSSNNGTIAIRVASGLYLREIHDVSITSPVDNGSLYYKNSEGLWRDTTAALLVSDTASMLSNYATKAYADTTGRFYARQDFSNVSSSTLTWTQSDTLVTGNEEILQVYRNGQILLPSQYTVPTNATVVIAATSYKVGENYTVIFPRGGGGGGGSGSGSLTSISGGTGITVSPNPITTTGTVSADLTVLMELTDTSLLNLPTRFASKLNTTDTLSLSERIDTKGSGTVTNIATGYGITGGAITTTGTLRLDSSSVYNYIRDSIVDVQIGNDTIKILKQEYNNVTSDTLVWTTTAKFPIQIRAYILLFRNGQLLINDQYSVIDTNKIKVSATSYKIGENYTLVTVSGIGSAGVSQTGNPVYPEAGIALSTGTTWTTSIPNNSSNWNTAFNDRFKWDGGNTGLVAATGRTSLGGTTIGQSMFTLTNPSATTFPRFNDNNTVTALSATNFRTAIGAGSVTTVTVAASTPLSIQNNTTTPEISMAAASGSVNGYLSSTDWTTFNGKQNALGNASASVSGILTSTDWTTFNNKQNALSNASSTVSGILTSTDWTTFNNKQNQLNGTGFVKANGTSITYDNSTYLPLTGGTLTGDLNAKYLNTFAKTTYVPFNAGIGEQSIFNVGTTLRGGTVMVFPDSNLVGSSANIFLANSSVQGVEYSAMGSGIRNYSKQGGDNRRNSLAFYTSGIGSQNTNRLFIDFDGNVGINDDTPSFKLDVNGTLNATGATTLSSTLAVTGNITESGNNVLTNLDTASLSSRIDGKVSLTATETISGTKTFNNLVNIGNQMTISGSASNANILLGKNTSNNGVADITLGNGFSITSNVLNVAIPTERYYFDLGIVAGAADNSASTYDFTYGSNIFIVPTSLNGYCIDSVYIRAIGCSTCPPVAGDKDYYVGVYKANAGARVTTSGATLVGSQITMNEYDLNEVNRNDTLSTGEAWWVYLNGTYTSDMAYVTAGFIVKKTCN